MLQLKRNIFFPGAARASPRNAAIDIVVVFYELSVVAKDAFVRERGEFAMKDFPIAYLTTFLF